MAILRFPNSVENNGKPHVLFSTHKSTYENSASAYSVVNTGSSVALYIPTNYSVNDLFQYENESTGAIGNIAGGILNGNDITQEDVKAKAEAIGFDQAKSIGAILGAVLGANTGGAVGAVTSGVTSASTVGNVVSEYSKTYQKTLNPRNFILFKSPGIRQFGFNFSFIPSDENEVNAIPEIIKFFRSASYPSTVGGNIQFEFPLAFNIKFVNSNGIIKIPEVVCIGTNITYNPNSMSYFKMNNFPVEVTLQLSFQELQPIDKNMVDRGF